MGSSISVKEIKDKNNIGLDNKNEENTKQDK